MRILLARHAKTGKAYKGRYIGSTDLPISEKGVQQAEDLAKRLEMYNPCCCFSSPMTRTRQTSDIVCSKLGIPCEFKKGLVEIDFGAWEGMTFAEIAKSYPEEVDRWSSEGMDFHFPAGDKSSEFSKRVQDVSSLLSQNPASPLLIVSHGGVIRTMICHFLGLSFESYLLFDVKPARFAVLDIFDQGGVLSGLNL